MKNGSDKSKVSQELRSRAEKQAQNLPPVTETSSSIEQMQRLIHELQVHQIELEMQNDELETSRLALEQKNAELADRNEKLIESEQKLLLQGTALETTANAVVITDVTGIVRWVNPAFTTLTGYSSEEVVGQNPRVLKSGEHDAAFYQKLWDTLLAGKTWRGDFVNRRKDGSFYNDEHTITPVQAKDGSITHFIAIMNDVTERRLAEKELKLLYKCISRLNDLVVITEAEPIDEPGPRIVFVNEAFERLTGYTSAEALGRNPRFLQCENTDPAVRNEIREALRLKQPIRRKIINRAKDGTEYCLDMDNVPIFDDKGVCTYFAAIERDITKEQKDSEQIAEQAEFLDKARDAIMVRDLDGKIIFWNNGAQRLYGWTREEALGRNKRDLLFVNPPLFDETNRILMERGDVSKEVEQYTKDRRKLTVDAHWTLIRDAAGHPKSANAGLKLRHVAVQ